MVREDELTPTLKVVIGCPTLGRVNRGYETFAESLRGALSALPDTNVVLLHGGPTLPRTRNCRYVRHVRREQRLARLLGLLLRKSPDTIERFTFALAALLHLRTLRADVFIASERAVCSVISRMQRFFGVNIAVVFNNGGRHRPPFRNVDLVKHSSLMAYRWAIEAGEEPSRHILLEEGFDMPEPARTTRSDARRTLGLPSAGRVLLSVGVLDYDEVKRHSYVAEETALSGEDFFVLLVGPEHAQTRRLRMLLDEALPGRHRVLSLPIDEMSLCYQSADLFVSASCSEGFGRSIVEAMLHGVPVLVNADAGMLWLTGRSDVLVNMNEAGALAGALRTTRPAAMPPDAKLMERFCWPYLGPRYRAMLGAAVERSRAVTTDVDPPSQVDVATNAS